MHPMHTDSVCSVHAIGQTEQINNRAMKRKIDEKKRVRKYYSTISVHIFTVQLFLVVYFFLWAYALRSRFDDEKCVFRVKFE